MAAKEEAAAAVVVEWEEDVHPAIINYDVLENIFSFLKPNDVKEARLVCKLWATVGKKELGNQTFLVINKLDFGNLEDGEIPSIHPHFVRKIKINLERGLTVYSPKAVDHFLPFLTFHGSKIEEFLFQGQDYFLRPIKTVLEAVEFPNLRKISLHELDQGEEEVAGLDGFDILSVLLGAVTTLEFWPSEYGEESFHDKWTNERNFPLFQEIINKCPNLEELKVLRQFYPDLSSCVNLKALEWVGPSSKISSIGGRETIVFYGIDFDIRRTIEMLDPVKDRLENLSLGSPVDREAGERYLVLIVNGEVRLRVDMRTRYLYPSMPKLTKFSVSDVRLFGISFESFTQDRLPALENLCLGSKKKFEFPITALFSDWRIASFYKEAGAKLESLSLNHFPLGSDEEYNITDLSRAFPNLKELTLGLSAGHFGSNLLKFMNSVAQGFHNLRNLTIDIKFPCMFTELMDSVSDIKGGVQDLKTLNLKLVAPAPKLIIDFGLALASLLMHSRIWESLSIFKSLTLQGFEIREDSRKKMQEFVVERDLKNIYFLP